MAVGVIALECIIGAIAAGSLAGFPVVGVLIAAAVLGVGFLIKWGSKKYMKSKLKDWVSSAVSVSRDKAVEAMNANLSAAAEQAIELMDRDVRCALQELESEAEAESEGRKLQGAQLEQRVSALRADEALATRMLDGLQSLELAFQTQGVPRD